VVSNTSPLSNLAIINRLDLVREQLGAVTIPLAVQTELSRLPDAIARARLRSAVEDGWLRTSPISGVVSVELAARLDAGEAEALVLALELKASMVLLDESAARNEARRLGLARTGALGLLRQARKAGRIDSLQAEILRLRREARFFVSPALEKALLISVGEGLVAR
jgi:uncharacterized protein